jgi:hypothetical protein
VWQKTVAPTGTRLLIVLLLLLPFVRAGFAAENSDVAEMSDEELVLNLHRKDALDEYDRRLHEYSEESRRRLRQLYEDRTITKKYPKDFSDRELMNYLRTVEDVRAYSKAQDELVRRHPADSAAGRDSLVDLFRVAFEENIPQTGDGIVLVNSVDLEAQIGLALAAGELLPETETVSLLHEVYVKSNRIGGITDFLRALEVSGSRGNYTAEVLGELYAHVQTIDPETRQVRRENPELELMIVSLLGSCGEDGFEALKKVNWSDPGIGIQSMGAIGTLEARDELLALYERYRDKLSDRRLTILSALVKVMHKTNDELTRDLIREELSEFILIPASKEELEYCRRAVEIAAYTRDTYFLPDLKALQNHIDTHGMSIAVEHTEVDVAAEIQQIHTTVADSIGKLETNWGIGKAAKEDG